MKNIEALVSNCCGAADREIKAADASYSDLGQCPRCGEPCVWMTEDEREEEIKLEILSPTKTFK